MPFSSEFVEGLIHKEDRETAEFFNSLPIKGNRGRSGESLKSIEYQNEIHKLQSKINKIIQKKEISIYIKEKIEYLKEYKNFKEGKGLYEALESLEKSWLILDTNDLDKMIYVLSQNAEDKKINVQKSKLVEILNEYKEWHSKLKAESNRPAGLYGYLADITFYLRSNFKHSFLFEESLLKVSREIISLFKILEQEGDLRKQHIEILSAIQMKIKVIQAKYKNEIKNEYQETYQRNEAMFDEEYREKFKKINDKLGSKKEELLKKQKTIEQKYTLRITGGRTAAERKAFLKEKEKKLYELKNDPLSKEIAELEHQYENLEKNKAKKMKQCELFLLKEEEDVEFLLKGMIKELDYIKEKIKLLEAQKRVPLKEKQIVNPELHGLIRNHDYVKDFCIKNRVNVVAYFRQAGIAAMGRHDGLCIGYSADFLDVCDKIKGFEKFSLEERILKFNQHKIVRDDTSHGMKRGNPNINRNYLAMTLSSALKWDLQKDLHKNATLCELKNKSFDKPKTFFSNYVDSIINIISADPEKVKKLIFTISEGEQSGGHAIGLYYDKSSILFHDSNHGLFSIPVDEDLHRLRNFLNKYFIEFYSSFSSVAFVRDFDVMKKNIEKHKLDKAKIALTGKSLKRQDANVSDFFEKTHEQDGIPSLAEKRVENIFPNAMQRERRQGKIVAELIKKHEGFIEKAAPKSDKKQKK